MKKSEFCAAWSKDILGVMGIDLSPMQASAMFDLFIGTIKKELAKNGVVPLCGLGVFRVKERAARNGRNPKTGEAIQIPAGTTLRFKAGAAVKRLLSK